MPRLIPHISSPCDALAGIEAAATRLADGSLSLAFIAEGRIDNLTIPAPAVTRRTDGLWQHTCFEAFVRAGDENAYCEFNFSPSGEWAAYRFKDYRKEMAQIEVAVPPRIDIVRTASRFEMHVLLAPEMLPESALAWQTALSGVIEETNGRKSYWALAHPEAKPDFHQRDSFQLELAQVL